MMKINGWVLTMLLCLILAVGVIAVACGGGDDDDDDNDDNDTATDDDLTLPDDDAGDDGDDDLWDDDANDDVNDDVNDDADDDNTGCEGCLINNTCFDDGEVNPGNACKVCDVSLSEISWTNDDGASCEDGLWCNGADACQGGTCRHGDDPCPNDDAYCNGEEYCDELTDSCMRRNEPDCPSTNGLYCDGGECNEQLNHCDPDGYPCGLWGMCLENTDECVASPDGALDVLYCGETLSGNNLWQQNVLEDYSCITTWWWGKWLHDAPDSVYFFEVWDNNMTLSLTWTPGPLAIDLDILIVTDYASSASCVLSSTEDGVDEPGHDELSLGSLPFGNYYVVVDGKRSIPMDAGLFELSADCQ